MGEEREHGCCIIHISVHVSCVCIKYFSIIREGVGRREQGEND